MVITELVQKSQKWQLALKLVMIEFCKWNSFCLLPQENDTFISLKLKKKKNNFNKTMKFDWNGKNITSVNF